MDIKEIATNVEIQASQLILARAVLCEVCSKLELRDDWRYFELDAPQTLHLLYAADNLLHQMGKELDGIISDMYGKRKKA